MKGKGRPKKCWYCAKLGKCQILKPCKDFVKYDYSREIGRPKKRKKKKYVTTREVGRLCGVSGMTISKWLKIDSKYALETIKARTGLDLEYIESKGGRHRLVKKEGEA